MAIEIDDLIEIVNVVSQIPDDRKMSLLFIGDARIYPSAEEIQRLFPDWTLPTTRQMSAKNIGHQLGFGIVDTLGLEGDLDHNFDLMNQLPDYLKEKYDLIIDAGVTYWTFNPGIAVTNYAKMLKSGAVIVHLTAVSGFYGSAYYNIHPRFFADFYILNGFEFKEVAMRQRWGAHDYRHLFKYISNKVLKHASTSRYISVSPSLMSNPEGFLNSRRGHVFRSILGKTPELKNNVLGIFVFQKGNNQSIKSPHLLESSISKRKNV